MAVEPRRRGSGCGAAGCVRGPQPRWACPPLPAPVLEDDGDAAVGEDDLEVAAPHGPVGPPALLDPPLLAHRLDRAPVDLRGQPVLPDRDGDGAGSERAEPADEPTVGGTGRVGRGGHGEGGWRRQRGTSPNLRSGRRLAASTSTIRRAASGATAERTWRDASASRPARATPSSRKSGSCRSAGARSPRARATTSAGAGRRRRRGRSASRSRSGSAVGSRSGAARSQGRRRRAGRAAGRCAAPGRRARAARGSARRGCAGRGRAPAPWRPARAGRGTR